MLREKLTVTWQRRVINLQDQSTSVYFYGDEDAPTILAVHGFRGTHWGLEPLAKELARQGYRVIVPDIPGCGESSPLRQNHSLSSLGAWLQQLWTAVGRPRIVIGHSFGTAIVSSACAQGITPAGIVLINPIAEEPASVARLTTAIASFYFASTTKLPPRMAQALLASTAVATLSASVMTKTADPLVKRWIREEHVRRAHCFNDSAAAVDMFHAAAHSVVDPFQLAPDTAVLVVAGGLDSINSLEAQATLATTHRGATLRTLAECGHLIPYEAPQRTAEIIRGWDSVAVSSPGV